MGIIYANDRGRLVEVTDAYGTYYYLGGNLGDVFHGAWSKRETAELAWNVSDDMAPDAVTYLEMYPATDVEINEFGNRICPCAYCNNDVPILDVPAPDDDDAWDELSKQHADDCEWVLTRAHHNELPND
jgi:hypothetical protein